MVKKKFDDIYYFGCVIVNFLVFLREKFNKNGYKNRYRNQQSYCLKIYLDKFSFLTYGFYFQVEGSQTGEAYLTTEGSGTTFSYNLFIQRDGEYRESHICYGFLQCCGEKILISAPVPLFFLMIYFFFVIY